MQTMVNKLQLCLYINVHEENICIHYIHTHIYIYINFVIAICILFKKKDSFFVWIKCQSGGDYQKET